MLGAPFDLPSIRLPANRRFAHGEPFDTSNALSERSESKGNFTPSFICALLGDDGIVVFVWFVYIVRCSNGSLYVGETNDVGHRVADHNRGRGSAHTAKYRPVQLAYVEEHPDREASLRREQQLKGWTRAKKAADSPAT
jgi:putative endonuclease